MKKKSADKEAKRWRKVRIDHSFVHTSLSAGVSRDARYDPALHSRPEKEMRGSRNVNHASAASSKPGAPSATKVSLHPYRALSQPAAKYPNRLLIPPPMP